MENKKNQFSGSAKNLSGSSSPNSQNTLSASIKPVITSEIEHPKIQTPHEAEVLQDNNIVQSKKNSPKKSLKNTNFPDNSIEDRIKQLHLTPNPPHKEKTFGSIDRNVEENMKKSADVNMEQNPIDQEKFGVQKKNRKLQLTKK